MCAMGQRLLDTTCRRAKRLGVCFGKFGKGGRGGGGGVTKTSVFLIKPLFGFIDLGGWGGQTVIYNHLAQMD